MREGEGEGDGNRRAGDGGQDGEERREHRPTLELLSRLQRQHLTHIPFETLDLHVGKQVRPLSCASDPQDVLAGWPRTETAPGEDGGSLARRLLLRALLPLLVAAATARVPSGCARLGCVDGRVGRQHTCYVPGLPGAGAAGGEGEGGGGERRKGGQGEQQAMLLRRRWLQRVFTLPSALRSCHAGGGGPRAGRQGGRRKVVKGLGMNEQASTWRNRIRFHARREASEEEIARGLEFVQTSDRIFFNTHSANHQPWLQITHNGARWSLVGRDLTKIPFPNRLQNEEEDQRERRSIESEEEYRKILKDRFLVVLEGADFTELPLFH
eukprot:705054-Hanusia_phi.AAC.1